MSLLGPPAAYAYCHLLFGQQHISHWVSGGAEFNKSFWHWCETSRSAFWGMCSHSEQTGRLSKHVRWHQSTGRNDESQARKQAVAVVVAATEKHHHEKRKRYTCRAYNLPQAYCFLVLPGRTPQEAKTFLEHQNKYSFLSLYIFISDFKTNTIPL